MEVVDAYGRLEHGAVNFGVIRRPQVESPVPVEVTVREEECIVLTDESE